uniref:Uncharacterized protein n=1 Tax=Oryza meridionalis TaxID=40149 RepID=A0A0E0DCE0_9ORYZ
MDLLMGNYYLAFTNESLSMAHFHDIVMIN